MADKTKRDLAIEYILRQLYWDPELEEWDPDAARNWNGFDELSQINYILLDQGLIPTPGDDPPIKFPR